jgi:hypothetical protein
MAASTLFPESRANPARGLLNVRRMYLMLKELKKCRFFRQPIAS